MVPTGRHGCPAVCYGEEIQLLLESHPELGPFLYGAGKNITWKNLAAILEGDCSFHPFHLPSQKDSSYLDINLDIIYLEHSGLIQ